MVSFRMITLTIGEISIHEIVKDIMALGLAPSSEFLIKMISIVLKKSVS
jgi:hypothetical protein